MFSIIAAIGTNNVIGVDGHLPWKIREDLRRFKEITIDSTVIMGRRTWESIGSKPLPDRTNIVVSRSLRSSDVTVYSSFKEAVDSRSENERVFVIGGTEMYQEALNDKRFNSLYITSILYPEYNGDTHFPSIDDDWEIVEESKIQCEDNQRSLIPTAILFKYITYRRRHDEYQYIELVKNILDHGVRKNDTRSITGYTMRFNLRNNTLPRITVKDTFYKGVLEEMLWFIEGCTDSKKLHDRGVKIWDANGSRAYLDKKGFTDRREGDLGPVYGFQWRHFGAKYTNLSDTHPTNIGGVDQLQYVIDQLRNNSYSRQTYMSSWNPVDLPQMALPPCHVSYHFIANPPLNSGDKKRLSCILYQRSGDVGLGVPFNIASASTLTHLIAKICDMEADELIHHIGDAHIYDAHIPAIEQLLDRIPYEFPKLMIDDNVNTIDGLQSSQFKVIGYKHHPRIKLDLIT